MKKALIITLALIIIALMTAGVLWNLVPGIVSKKLTKAMGVKVHIAALSKPPANISAKGLFIDNPPGSVLKRALAASSIDTDMSYFSIFNQKIVIDHVELNDVYLGLEFNSKLSSHGNWTAIMNHLDASTKAKAGSSKSKMVLIKTLIIKNLKIDLAYRSDPKKVIHLKPIDQMVIHNVGSNNGHLAEQISAIVLNEMLKQVFSKENITNMIERIITDPSSSWKETFKQFINPGR